MTTFARCQFDEVHPLIFRSAMYLKTCTAVVSSEAVPNEEFLLHARAARKDSAVHVSLSSDSLFKQPGDHGDPHPPVSRRAGEARASENYRIPIHCSSEELQRRAIAPLADGAPMGCIYASPRRLVNQKCPISLAHETVLQCPPTKFAAQQINNALMHKTPHSGHIPASSLRSFRGTESRHGGLQPPSIRPGNSGSCPSLTGRRPAGIVPALDSSGLSTALGFVATSHLRSEAHGDGELGPNTVARRNSITTGRRHRARQRTAAVRRRRIERLRRPPPRFSAMVCRHDFDRALRRCSHGRRRFHVS